MSLFDATYTTCGCGAPKTLGAARCVVCARTARIATLQARQRHCACGVRIPGLRKRCDPCEQREARERHQRSRTGAVKRDLPASVIEAIIRREMARKRQGWRAL
jgi:hypothetical protein